MTSHSTTAATGTTLTWHKSSYSNDQGGNCIEVAAGAAGLVPVRDTKDRSGGSLVFSTEAWVSFVAGVRAGDFRQRG
jgi:hypothetical protein